MTFLLSTAVSVSLSGRSKVFYEEDGVGTVCVVLSQGQLDGTISATVALSSSSGSASSGSEITPHHQPLGVQSPPPHLQVTIY